MVCSGFPLKPGGGVPIRRVWNSANTYLHESISDHDEKQYLLYKRRDANGDYVVGRSMVNLRFEGQNDECLDAGHTHKRPRPDGVGPIHL